MNTNTQPKVFEWTDELVKEIIQDIQKDGGKGITDYDFYIRHFIKEKQQPIEERIVVSDMYQMYINQEVSKKTFLRVSFNVESISNDKYPEIKLAIEGVLNNETWLQQQEQIKRDKLNKQAEVLFAPYDTRQTVDNTDLKPQPQDTKEDNPDWEIVAYIGKYLGYNDCIFNKYNNTSAFKLSLPNSREYYLPEGDVAENCKIYSVTRKSDNEVFTVGDSIESREGEYCVWDNIYNIISISVKSGTLAFEIMNIEETNPTGSIWREINNIRKKAPKEEQSPVLFVTHDGVNVYGGEHLYSVDNKTWGILSDDCNNEREATLWNKGDDKIFSSKEAAEQYIITNKPLLSISDCCIGLPSGQFDRLTEIAKEKLANTKINIQ